MTFERLNELLCPIVPYITTGELTLSRDTGNNAAHQQPFNYSICVGLSNGGLSGVSQYDVRLFVQSSDGNGVHFLNAPYRAKVSDSL